MTDDQDAYEYTVNLQRGDGTDDRDKHKAKVTASTIEELREKVEQVREMMQEEVEETREIQPSDVQSVAEEHQTFEQYEESEA